ncbi:class I SAM-dependent methyltransferase [Luteibacter sp.]|uniref:class I SAM-dependent methyltransferase n=1 Tax=Luteibacter sp. TaxID=1886636 RepID=UPI00280978CD|nr:class I SAM-dependent methyltransferase [Luteibacter sp.]MDQ8051298.1 class I SAM-dependent methyltransferase [Luteibacter sp.]
MDSTLYPMQVSAGRDIGAGHLRGWGLEYGDLRERVGLDPMFQEAMQAAQDRGSLVVDHKLANLYLIIRYAMDPASDIFEFGSFSGGSAVFMATLLKALGRSGRVHAFDTFEGMPDTDVVRDLHKRGDFADTRYRELLEYIDERQLGSHVTTVKGRFDQTLPSVIAARPRVGLIHVDCDIYEPIKYVIRESRPALVAGCHVAFDDPLHGSCLGAFDAVQELMIRELALTAEQAYPHMVFRLPALRGDHPEALTGLRAWWGRWRTAGRAASI